MTQPPHVQNRAWLELPGGKLHPFERECRIGRVPAGNDLVLPERTISSRHAIVSSTEKGYSIVDQDSTNGTDVNGVPVKKPTKIKDGDEIQIAKTISLRFRCTREEPPASAADLARSTEVLRDFEPRECWLLLIDIVGFSGLVATLGDEVAVRRLQTWISDVRPLIEDHRGTINRYVGDAIFACWPCAGSLPRDVLSAIRSVEEYRGRSPVAFRAVLHHGLTLFSRSEVGDELSGQEVIFLFRAEKIAKRFGSQLMFSEAAVRTLQLEGTCEPIGKSVVEGIEGDFAFFRPRLI